MLQWIYLFSADTVVPDQAEVKNKSCSFDMRYACYCTSTSPLRWFRFAVLQKSWIIFSSAQFFALVHCGGYIISLSLKGDCNENWCGRRWSLILGQRFRAISLLNMPTVYLLILFPFSLVTAKIIDDFCTNRQWGRTIFFSLSTLHAQTRRDVVPLHQ